MEVNSLRSWKLKWTNALCSWHPLLSSGAEGLTSSLQSTRYSPFYCIFYSFILNYLIISVQKYCFSLNFAYFCFTK